MSATHACHIPSGESGAHALQPGITRLRDFALTPTLRTYDVWQRGGRVMEDRTEMCAELFRSRDPRGEPVVYVDTAAMSGAFRIRRVLLMKVSIQPYAQYDRMLFLSYRLPEDRRNSRLTYAHLTPGFFLYIGPERFPGAADALQLPALEVRSRMAASERVRAMLTAQRDLRSVLDPWIDLTGDAIDNASGASA